MNARLLPLCVALGLTAAIVATAQARTPKSAVVALRKTSLGTILVDPRGRTLYLFEKDSKGTSACTSACLSYWPAFTSRTVPSAGTGVRQSLLGLAKPRHGLRQVTYAGHPPLHLRRRQARRRDERRRAEQLRRRLVRAVGQRPEGRAEAERRLGLQRRLRIRRLLTAQLARSR